MAIAAFLGESGLFRQIIWSCCVNVTNWDRPMTFWPRPGLSARPFREGFPQP